MKNLFIHIGDSKTGTTTIQKWLNENSNILLDKKYYYAYTGRDKININHRQLTFDYNNKNEVYDLWRDFDKEIEKTNIDNIILSAENFFNFYFYNDSIRKFYNRFKKYNIILILYLRPQYEHLFSLYKQHVKNRYVTLKFEEWYVDRELSYLKKIWGWNKFVSKENINILDFNIVRKTGLVNSFLKAIKIDNFHIMEPTPANIQISNAGVLIQRGYNLLYENSQDKSEKSTLNGILRDKKPEKDLCINTEVFKNIFKKTRSENIELCRYYNLKKTSLKKYDKKFIKSGNEEVNKRKLLEYIDSLYFYVPNSFKKIILEIKDLYIGMNDITI